METYFALIEDNKVVRVEVATPEFVQANPERYKGLWKQVGTPTQPFVGGEAVYLPGKDKIVRKKPFNSWLLDDNDNWVAPKAKPNGNYEWDEERLDWVKP